MELGVMIPDSLKEKINNYLFFQGQHSNELNPFVEWDIDVEGIFYHAASGIYKIVDGYYTRDYVENPITDDWDDLNTFYPFRIRYAPPQNGKWIALIRIKINNQEVYASGWFGFDVVESGDPGYVYVHPNKKNLMRGSRMIFPVGQNFHSPFQHNIPWGGDTSSYLGNKLSESFKNTNTLEWQDYLAKIEEYFQKGGRYIRTIQSAYSSLIEFEKKGNYYDRLHYAWEQDKLLDLCEQYDGLMEFNLLLQGVFKIYDEYNTPSWDWDKWWRNGSNNYIYNNLSFEQGNTPYCYNDNPAQCNPKKPREALTNEEDLKYHEQRTRYYIARYGYSTKIYDFQLLSEPFGYGRKPGGDLCANNNLDDNHPVKPFEKDSIAPEEHDAYKNSVYTYQKRMSEYIKQHLGHTEHLIGVDCLLKNADDAAFDNSVTIATVDLVGINFYSSSPSKFSLNTIIKDNSLIIHKPIIVSEFGDGDGLEECSGYSGHFVDLMSTGFTGVCGYNMWEGGERMADATMLNQIWSATIRAQNHLNGDDVINTLSNGNGEWEHGWQEKKIINLKKYTYSKEIQYYVSKNKELAVGYVRNRSYNTYTKRIYTCYQQISDFQEPINNLYNFLWDDGSVGNRLKIDSLKKNKNYSIDFYSFKYGNYISSDCINSDVNGKLLIRFPTLFVSNNPSESQFENPVVWFVIKQKNCMVGLAQNDEIAISEVQDLSQSLGNTNIVLEEFKPQIYPNPFNDYIVVESNIDDVLIIKNIEGRIVLKQNVNKGKQQINTSTLNKGMYFIQLEKQSFTEKFTK
ncbi:MAG: T9SS type A sorting domain-containing protein [Crocinitomicaceae bacterium]|nr:T9SS type A sorting domain-containing protein [Crocinitomicaceae bacterium]